MKTATEHVAGPTPAPIRVPGVQGKDVGSTKIALYEDGWKSRNGTLKSLPDETLLFPGHLYSPEGSSTMGEQKRTNPYLRVTSLEMFLNFMGA